VEPRSAAAQLSEDDEDDDNHDDDEQDLDHGLLSFLGAADSVSSATT
jgi:hypothetical protein